MFDGGDPANLIGLRGFVRPGLALDLGDPINRDYVARWRAGDYVGAALRDISPNRLDAALTASPTRRTNIGGQTLGFNGSSQYSTATNARSSFARFTVSARIRPNFSSTSGTSSTVFQRASAETVRGMGIVWLGGTKSWYCDDCSGAVANIVFQTGVATPAFASGEEHHIAITFVQGGPAQFYWDGRPVTTTITHGAWGTYANLANANFCIGHYNSGNFLWNGDISAVDVFSRDLAAGEIFRLYREPLAGIISEDDRLYVPRKAPAGGTVWNETLSDSLTAAESVAGTLTAPVTLAEALTGADATTVALTGAVALAEALTGADSHAATLAAVAVLSESATAGDVLAPAMTAGMALSDAGTVADDLLPAVTFGLALSDSLTGADSLTIAAVMAAALAESVAGAENFAAVLLASTSLTDAAALADAYALAIPGTPAPASRTVTWRAHDRLATWATEARTVTWRAVDRIAKWQE